MGTGLARSVLGVSMIMLLMSAVGCGASQSETDLQNRTVVRRGFKFVLPPGDDWVTRENAEGLTYALVSKRTVQTFAETVTIHSGRHPFSFSDNVDFGDQMSRMVQRGFQDERYTVKELNVQVNDRFGPLCVRRWSVVEDARAQGVASAIPLEVRTLGFTFILPSDRGRLVHVEYAVRGTGAEVAASDWQGKAETFFAGIEVR